MTRWFVLGAGETIYDAHARMKRHGHVMSMAARLPPSRTGVYVTAEVEICDCGEPDCQRMPMATGRRRLLDPIALSAAEE